MWAVVWLIAAHPHTAAHPPLQIDKAAPCNQYRFLRQKLTCTAQYSSPHGRGGVRGGGGSAPPAPLYKVRYVERVRARLLAAARHAAGLSALSVEAFRLQSAVSSSPGAQLHALREKLGTLLEGVRVVEAEV